MEDPQRGRLVARPRLRLLGAMVLSGLLLVPAGLLALGLGPLETKSRLNQRFVAQIALIGLKPGDLDSLSVRIGDDAAFAREGIERGAIYLDLQFEVVTIGPTSGHIVVRSGRVIREPSLQFVVEANVWGGRRLRTYAVLLNTD